MGRRDVRSVNTLSRDGVRQRNNYDDNYLSINNKIEDEYTPFSTVSSIAGVSNS